MNIFANTFLLVYAALFPIVNPVGSAPLFLGMTRFSSDAARNRLAWRVAVNSFFLLLGSLLGAGMPVLHMMGKGLGVDGRIATSNGAFLFIWTLLAIGVTSLFSAILAVRGLWSLRRRAL